jgi:hypothetical protein
VHFVEGREEIDQTSLMGLVSEADSPASLDNLTLTTRQDSPLREVTIQIGPGKETHVTVKADDHTWALGRHTEIMERLNKTRKWYAAGDAHVPEWPKKPDKARRAAAIRFIITVIQITIGLPVALALCLAAAFVIDIPYIVGYRLIHHQAITGILLTLLFIDLVAISGIIFAISMSFAASRSRVIVSIQPFLTPGRISAITATTAMIGAITAIIGIIRK